jgi:hypothetical protein
VKIRVWLMEHGSNLKIDIGVYKALTIWDATEAAKKRYPGTFKNLSTRFYTEAEPAHDAAAHVRAPRLRDTTIDIFPEA